MQSLRLLKTLTVRRAPFVLLGLQHRTLSLLGMMLTFLGLALLNHGPSWAAEPLPPGPVATATPPTCVDVALRPDGTLWGRVVAPGNAPTMAVAQVPVTFVQGKQVIARVQSDAAGQFAVAHLRGGIYQVSVDDSPLGSTRLCRVWTAQGAPPQALAELALAREPVVVRGQLALGMGIPAAAIAAGAITGPIVYNNLQKDNRVPVSP